MRFSTLALATAAASSASALNFTDTDGSVWDNVPETQPRTDFFIEHNRPTKRQDGWNPPSNLRSPLQQVWDHTRQTYNGGNVFAFRNYGWDQLRDNNGNINICVRWESGATVTEAQRNQVATTVARQYEKWFSWLYGFDAFPYSKVNVRVVGWAVRDRNLLQGSTSGIDVYTDRDGEGAPQCAPACGRFFHQDNNYSGCPGGAARHYDHSLWLTDGFGGGAGGDWGARIGREYFMNSINADNIQILLHEMGHTFGLDDFYDWVPSGVTNFIMLAGSSSSITDFDGWMLRNWWYEISRNRGWR